MRASNADLERQVAADPLSVSVEHVADPEEQHIEMVRICPSRAVARAPPRPIPHPRLSSSLQDLACGLFEAKPTDRKGGGGGPSGDGEASHSDNSDDSDDSDDSDELQQLQLPAHQTAAVSAAKKAGRTLVAEIEDGGGGDDDEACCGDEDSSSGSGQRGQRGEEEARAEASAPSSKRRKHGNAH
jgi:hypothetical protein